LLGFVRESFNEVRTAKRVDGVGHAGFVRDDLLGTQGDGGREFGWQGPRFVKRIRV